MRRLAPEPSRVHAVTLAVWLSGIVALALLWTFPRFFGALLLLALAVVAYGLLYVFVEARMAAADFANEDPLEKEDPVPEEAPVAAPRPRRKKASPRIAASEGPGAAPPAAVESPGLVEPPVSSAGPMPPDGSTAPPLKA